MKRSLVAFAFLIITSHAALGGVAETFEINAAPSGGIASNTAIEIIEHNGGVWMATSKGLTFSMDDGLSWHTYDSSNGLVSNSVSALYSEEGALWIATNHTEMRQGELYSFSDGLSYTGDNGDTWTQVDFSSIPFVWGADRTIFDITGHPDTGYFGFDPSRTTGWMFFSAFAGGLLASQDGGMSWRRIYHSAVDSIQFNGGGQPSVRNRNFSCVVDTSHGDTVMLWTGTAGGVFQYVYVPPAEKFYSKQVNRIAICDTCTGEKKLVFLGGSHGLARGPLGGPYRTKFSSQPASLPGDLPGPWVTALIDIGGNLLVGTIDSATGWSEGLSSSTDLGASFSTVSFPGSGDADAVVSDFRHADGRLYMAASSAGLLRSNDSGLNWNPVTYGNFGVAANDSVNAVEILDDTLLLGTNAGLLELYTDGAGSVIDSSFKPFAEDDSSSSKIVRVEAQLFYDTLANYDSTAVWTVHRPTSIVGSFMVGRRGWDIDSLVIDTIIDTIVDTIIDSIPIPPDTTFDSMFDSTEIFQASDTNYVWKHFMVDTLAYDVEFLDRAAFVTDEFGTRFTVDGTSPDNPFGFFPGLDTILTMEVVGDGDTIIFGGDDGFAYTDDRGVTFTVSLANFDSLLADSIVNFTLANTGGGISGDFIPALGVDHGVVGAAHPWVSGRPALTGGYFGRSMGVFDRLQIDTIITIIPDDPQPGDTIFDTLIDTLPGFAVGWDVVDSSTFAWNFEFVGDSSYSATSGGLLLDTAGALLLTEKVDLLNDTVAGDLVSPDAAVFAVEHINPYLWVGTSDGTVRLDAMTLADGQLFARVDSTTPADQVYAFPIPYRMRQDAPVDFHFVVTQSGAITLEIYDFAMNLVARVIDNEYYDAGIYPNGQMQGRTWDGRNGRGDRVAVGVYYIKFKDATGDLRWGKVAVLP